MVTACRRAGRDARLGEEPGLQILVDPSHDIQLGMDRGEAQASSPDRRSVYRLVVRDPVAQGIDVIQATVERPAIGDGLVGVGNSETTRPSVSSLRPCWTRWRAWAISAMCRGSSPVMKYQGVT